MDQRFLSTSELASLLGVSRITIFNRIKKGILKAKKIGRNFVIDTDDLPPELIPKKARMDSDTNEKEVEKAVKKTVEEYGETLRLLGKE
jgi:excisionase family DNA binding protein